MEIETEKRAGYSLFFFPSVFHREQLRLTSRALERALIEFETTPGLERWEFVDAQAPYVFAVQQKKAVLPLAVHIKGRSRQLVQLVTGSGSPGEEAAIAAGQQYASSRGFGHLVFANNRQPLGPYERQNRECAHAWLRTGQRWETKELEDFAARLGGRPGACLSTLQQEGSLSPTQARLVFVRCWLRGLLAWDIGHESIAGNLQVKPT
jgi:hypothetical protein